MNAKFEEKTFESYFNNELDRKSDIYFPPGQVLEGSLGFDASAFSQNRKLWKRLGFPYWFQPHFRGLSLREIADEMELILNIELEDIPFMKANLLFQYKRPEYIKSSLGSEWNQWEQPYYRYDINSEQQDLLYHIHQKFSSDVLIVYASPCTIDINELVKNRKKIIDFSNFAKAVDLHGHYRNTYIKAGTYSIACSEPSKIDNLNIVETIKNFAKEDLGSKKKNNKSFLIDFSSKIQSLVNEYEYLADSFAELNEDVEKFKNYKLFYSLIVMNNFRQLTGLQWIIIT